jgi:hypothetical protein
MDDRQEHLLIVCLGYSFVVISTPLTDSSWANDAAAKKGRYHQAKRSDYTI